MYFTNPFRYFDPEKGPAPGHFSGAFEQIAGRARRILQSRNGAAILRAWAAIRWMFENGAVREKKWDNLVRMMENVESVEDDYGIDPALDSDVALLLACREHVTISDYENFPNGTWPEYFAVLALAFIGLASDDEVEFSKRSGGRQESRDMALCENLGYWAIDAMEALSVAESLQREEALIRSLPDRIETEHKRKTSLQAKKAAIARHADLYALKEDFVEFRMGHADVASTSEVARRFLKSLPPERAKLLAPTNAVRTLCNTWTAYQKDRAHR